MSHHYFIGIKIPSQIGEVAKRFREEYRLIDAYKVIPHHDDLHVTLLFLGGIEEDHLHTVTNKLLEIGANISSFPMYVNGLSYFGSSTGPRVVYLSVANCSTLTKLQNDINQSIPPLLSLPRDDRFVPHITIAKKRKTTEKVQINKQSIEPMEVQINEFSLFKIHQMKSPKYEVIEQFPLND